MLNVCPYGARITIEYCRDRQTIRGNVAKCRVRNYLWGFPHISILSASELNLSISSVCLVGCLQSIVFQCLFQAQAKSLFNP